MAVALKRVVACTTVQQCNSSDALPLVQSEIQEKALCLSGM